MATVSPSGLVTGVGAGAATIEVKSEGKTATSAVTVLQAPVASVTVTPASVTVAVGAPHNYSTLKAADGAVLTGRVVTWTTRSTAVATVSTSGLVTGVGAGTVTITATSEGKTGTSTITVAPVVATIDITPVNPSVAVGQSIALVATAKDAAGKTVSGVTFMWETSEPTLAGVTGAGLVTGLAVGNAEIRATAGGITGRAALTVLPPPLSPAAEAILQSALTVVRAADPVLAARDLDATIQQQLGGATVDEAGVLAANQRLLEMTTQAERDRVDAALAGQLFGDVPPAPALLRTPSVPGFSGNGITAARTSGPPTAVIYVNGIQNSFVEAFEARAMLAQHVLIPIGFSLRQYSYSLLYNPTEGILGSLDLVEATSQLLGVLLGYRANTAVAQRLTTIMLRYYAAGSQLLLVTHSQGNLIALEALGARNDYVKECIGVVSVATPTFAGWSAFPRTAVRGIVAYEPPAMDLLAPLALSGAMPAGFELIPTLQTSRLRIPLLALGIGTTGLPLLGPQYKAWFAAALTLHGFASHYLEYAPSSIAGMAIAVDSQTTATCGRLEDDSIVVVVGETIDVPVRAIPQNGQTRYLVFVDSVRSDDPATAKVVLDQTGPALDPASGPGSVLHVTGIRDGSTLHHHLERSPDGPT